MNPAHGFPFNESIPCPLCGEGTIDAVDVFSLAMARTGVTADTGCWVLDGVQGRYPVLTYKSHRIALHRFALALATGHWPEGMACHSCVVPGCWNPAHLREGDALGNNQDRRARATVYGRAGEDNH